MLWPPPRTSCAPLRGVRALNITFVGLLVLFAQCCFAALSTPAAAAASVSPSASAPTSARPGRGRGDSLLETGARPRITPLRARVARVISLHSAEVDVNSALRSLRAQAMSPATATPMSRFSTMAQRNRPQSTHREQTHATPGRMLHTLSLHDGRRVAVSVPYKTFSPPVTTATNNGAGASLSAFSTLSSNSAAAHEGTNTDDGKLQQWLVHVAGPVSHHTRSAVCRSWLFFFQVEFV